MADVQLIGVTKRFGKATAVADLSLDVGDGEFVILLGPTGAGKTTTLRLAAGLEKPDGGSVRIGGRDVTDIAPAERDIAFVFQQFSLYPHLSVFDNLAFPLRSPARRMGAEQIRSRVNEVASLLHIAPKLGNRASARGGGAKHPGGRPPCRAARCSGWRSGGRWCGGRPSISWTSRCRRSMPSSGASSGSS